MTSDLAVAESLVISLKLELKKLRFEIALLKRIKFGLSSEQLDRQLTQMQFTPGGSGVEAGTKARIGSGIAPPYLLEERTSCLPDLMRVAGAARICSIFFCEQRNSIIPIRNLSALRPRARSRLSNRRDRPTPAVKLGYTVR